MFDFTGYIFDGSPVKIKLSIWFHEQGFKAIEARAAIRDLGTPTTSMSHLIAITITISHMIGIH